MGKLPESLTKKVLDMIFVRDYLWGTQKRHERGAEMIRRTIVTKMVRKKSPQPSSTVTRRKHYSSEHWGRRVLLTAGNHLARVEETPDGPLLAVWERRSYGAVFSPNVDFEGALSLARQQLRMKSEGAEATIVWDYEGRGQE